jgi:hypothetical protein
MRRPGDGNVGLGWKEDIRQSLIYPPQRGSFEDMRPRFFLIAAGLIGMLGVAGTYGCRQMDRNHLAEMLDLETLPASVSDLDCESFGWTDVLERCAFAVSQGDFPKLLKAHQYQSILLCRDRPAEPVCFKQEGPETSHGFCCGPRVGRDFRIDAIYLAQPAEFEHGGAITVVADTTRQQVMVDLYIE